MQIYVNVINQKLMATTSLTNFVEGSQIFVQFTFNLDDAWDGLTVFAQFQQGENAYNVFLDDDNSVYMPTEIAAGKCTLLLYGSGSRDDDTVIATTNFLTLTVAENKVVYDAQSTEITQSLYDQMISRFRDTKDEIMSQFRDTRDQMTSDFRSMINGVYEMIDIDNNGIINFSPDGSGHDSIRPDEQIITETVYEYFDDHPVSDLIPDDSISESKLDDDLKAKINSTHVVGTTIYL